MDEAVEKHLYVLILCGGGGKRLWPRSRQKAPKQFIKIFNGRTLFQETVTRARMLVPLERVFICTNKDYVDEIQAQAPEIPLENIIAEPLAKNTALAMGLGTIFIHQVDPSAIVTNLASDHYISDSQKFIESVKAAVAAANKGDYLVTVGVKPNFPHTGMGYVKADALFEKIGDFSVFRVMEFVEKPDRSTAKKFVSESDYYWNANLYTWRADSILKAFRKYMPSTSNDLDEIRKSLEDGDKDTIIAKIYERAQEISIDKGVSEKADNMLLIPGDFAWSDVGDWKVIYDVLEKDANGNVIICEKGDGEFVGVQTSNCLVHFSDQLVATIGVDNLIIIDTKDALLIVDKNRAEDVKVLVNLLKEEGKTGYL